MSRWVKWIYSVGLLLAMCSILIAANGTYQYLDHLNIPYNINIFGCSGTASCTSMVLQDSAGNEKFVPGNPGSIQASANSFAVGAAQDGWDATQGTKADAAYLSGSGSVIAILKGIFTQLTTPISVTPSVSPQNVTVANTASPAGVAVVNQPSPVSVGVANSNLNVTSTPAVSPQGVAVVNQPNVSVANQPTVVLSGSPVSVGEATGVNVSQISGIPLASPTTYGAAPTGSVGAVNAFVTNQPTVVLSGSPVSVGVAAGSSPLNVTVGGITSPQNVTLATSPVSVAISTVSSPVNVTGSLSVTPASPQNTNLVQVDGQQIASPSTYGAAPVGSVQGVNAFVTNTVNATTTPAVSPQNVTIAGPTPLNVTLGTSPVSVAISTVSSPVNVTGTFTANSSSPTNVNLDQINGQLIASPSTYGAAPVGSVIGVNSFITNSPTVVLSGSPVSVGIAAGSSPINVTGSLSVTPASPQNTNLVQIQGVTVASASTYGAAPVGSVQGVNAFVTNNVSVTPPTPLNVTLGTSPVSVAISTVSSPVNVTGTFTANSSSPTNVNLDQVNGQLIASPSTYGAAPVGSVQGVNAFVTNNINVTPPTPLQVTLPASPVSVGIAGPTPLNVTVGNASPTNVNVAQWQGTSVASPSTYGVAPVGSVGAVNAFVTNNVNVTPPTPLQVTLPASPITVAISVSPQGVAVVNSPLSVGVANSSPTNVSIVQWQGTTVASPSTYGVAPIGSVGAVNAFVTNQPTVVLSGSPVSVGIAAGSSPINVTGSLSVTPASPQNISVVQWQGITVASPSTYGVAPVGSVGAVNSFVTNNVNVTPPTPLQITLPASPITVAISTSPQSVAVVNSPLSVGIANSSPTNINMVQWQGTAVASPSTYGVAPVGSVGAVNAFVTNNVNVTTPTPLQITLPASPIGVAIVSSPVNVTGNFSSTPVASNYEWNAGTGNSGNIFTQAITLQSVELNGLANAAVTLSTLSFNNAITTTGTSQAVWGEVFFTGGSAPGVTCTAGANIAGWFAATFLGATEGPTQSTIALARAPDFIIPLATSVSLTAYAQKAAGLVRLPSMPFKVISQNNCGVTIPAAGNVLYLIPMGVLH